jgi:hypothetical protein
MLLLETAGVIGIDRSEGELDCWIRSPARTVALATPFSDSKITVSASFYSEYRGLLTTRICNIDVGDWILASSAANMGYVSCTHQRGRDAVVWQVRG